MLAILNNASVDICINFYVGTFQIPSSGIAESYGNTLNKKLLA